MKLLITVKQAGRKKSFLTEKEYEIAGKISCLKDLIETIVLKEVSAYNNNKVDTPFVHFFTNEAIEEKAEGGKVGFGQRYNSGVQDPEKAVENALLSFEDGIYKVFLNDNELENLQSPVQLNENDHLVFIKLVMLAGGMWRYF